MKTSSRETLDKAIDILMRLKEANSIYDLKGSFVRRQDYDTAGKLRDIERDVLNKINPKDYDVVTAFLYSLETVHDELN